MSSNFNYMHFSSEDGMVYLVRPADIAYIILGRRREAKGAKPAGPYVVLILQGNIKVELVGETGKSITEKIGRVSGSTVVVFNADGEVPAHQLEPR